VEAFTKSAIAGAIQRVEAFSNRANVLALLALCLAVYLPGIIRLPAVDRTEVIYAETTRDMVARRTWLDPRYGEAVHAFRPIGTFWAQAVAATLAGADNARNISVYRIPGFIAVTLSVLALYWLAAPIVGAGTALIASGLFAVAPLTVVVSNLAIAEGLSLLPATVAMLALLRIYVAPRDEDARRLAIAFWTALGFGVLVNALLVPILVIATLIALRFMDRDLWWLGKLNAARGLPVAFVIAAPWIIVRFLQDGVPFSGFDFAGVLRALGGAQDMKARAWPGTFVLAAALGFLPGTALLAPTLLKLWNGRDAKSARFLLAWIIGYLIYLEAISSKPGTYMVQTMFPAFAIAVASLATSDDGKIPLPKFNAIPWPPLAALFALALLAAPYAAVHEHPPLWIIALAAVIAALFYWSAREGRAGHLVCWAGVGIAALGLFAITLLGGVLPGISKIWPMQQIQRAFAQCPAAPVGILGFVEPTSRFVFKFDSKLSTSQGLGQLADGTVPGFAVISDYWNQQNPQALNRSQSTKIRPIACMHTIDPMRACALTLTVVANTAVPPCPIQPEFACNEEFLLQSGAPGRLRICE
jgi:4-amino-4-deoxy-L-arabinose transferase-like glycosyltransferase